MTENPDRSDPRAAPAWGLLEQHAREVAEMPLATLLADASRTSELAISLEGLYCDCSRYRATTETLHLLLQLAEERRLTAQIEALFGGEIVNLSEGRAALHTALRGPGDRSPKAAEAARERDRFLEFADGVRSGERAGFGGRKFTRVINIGIGGSDLGPRMLVGALGNDALGEAPRVEFVAGIDGIELRDALAGADPASTLFIVCSKTFTTLETRINAIAARDWLLAELPAEAVGSNFVAVSANSAEVARFGIAPDRQFQIWDWVGGRYSLWSAIGLAAAIAMGGDSFRALGKGAAAMDEHFRTAELAENLPVKLGLLGLWNRNFLGLTHQVVLPYDHRLALLPAYLQQLVMESQGKRVRQDGEEVDYLTGGALWGSEGSSAQHSYAQWLHQGPANAHVDFVATANGPAELASGHLDALANMLAQADALAYGQDANAIVQAMQAAGDNADRDLVAHKVQPGNRSSLVLLLRDLAPYNLGLLIALFEHQVFVQSAIWGINPFDQWGVELGKQRAGQYAEILRAASPDADPQLVRQILKWRG